jgi:hypothetical protein
MQCYKLLKQVVYIDTVGLSRVNIISYSANNSACLIQNKPEPTIYKFRLNMLITVNVLTFYFLLRFQVQ